MPAPASVPAVRRLPALILLALLTAGCASGPDLASGTDTTGAHTPPPTATILLHESGGPRFEPATLNVSLGDAVLFRVVTGRHSIDFDPQEGISDQHSGDIGPQSPFAVRFTKAGTFPFHCAIHEEMVGAITVAV